MDETTTERRCLLCKKLMLDEKLPICHRCRLVARNKTGQILGVAGGSLVAIVSGHALVEDKRHESEGIDDHEIGDEIEDETC